MVVTYLTKEHYQRKVFPIGTGISFAVNIPIQCVHALEIEKGTEVVFVLDRQTKQLVLMIKEEYELLDQEEREDFGENDYEE